LHLVTVRAGDQHHCALVGLGLIDQLHDSGLEGEGFNSQFRVMRHIALESGSPTEHC
jgi:hypothetical protein